MKSDVFRPFIEVRLRSEQDFTKKLVSTYRETAHDTNVKCVIEQKTSTIKCWGLSQHQLLKISRKVAQTVPWPHGGSSFLAILQPSYFCEQQEN